MKSYTLDDLARMIDHTNLHTDASPKDMEVLCNEAKEHHFAMVAISQVQLLRSMLAKVGKGYSQSLRYDANYYDCRKY